MPCAAQGVHAPALLLAFPRPRMPRRCCPAITLLVCWQLHVQSSYPPFRPSCYYLAVPKLLPPWALPSCLPAHGL